MRLLILSATVLAAAVPPADAGPFRRARPASSSCPGGSCPAPVAFPAAPAAACPGGVCPVPAVTPAVTSPADGTDALDEVNALRAARGLRPYLRDAGLTEGARRLAAARAERRLFGHTPNDFAYLPAGSSAACTGCAAYPPGYGWLSCAVYDGYTYAGAAWVMGSDGRRYMHLVLR